VIKVGVFVNPTPDLVLSASSQAQLTLLQFHGEETPEFCTGFGLMSMKAFRMKDATVLETLGKYQTDAWLLDSFNPAAAGGTGESFNWDLAVTARGLGKPIFLAGGLTPENVGEAVRKVRPYGVDVSSGVEMSPGKKDRIKMRDFVQAAKGASAE
jgi:phosphoribosylanthranilate isomerase